MTRDEFLELIDKFDWNASYPWKHELNYLRAHDRSQREEIARLREALTRMTTGECGSFLTTRFPFTLRAAQAALAKEATRDHAR